MSLNQKESNKMKKSEAKEINKFSSTLKKMNNRLEKIYKEFFNEKGIMKIDVRRKRIN